MEEDQEVMMKHVCKFCRKSFASGRSLGGHMRSHDHDHDDNDYDHDDDGDELVVAVRRRMKKKEGYGLRENPKKTWRVLTDSTNEQEIQDPFDVVLDKLCKECGKGFQSMKALFGHMKCHKKKDSFELDEEEDSNASVLPKRKRRSKRKLRTRYIKSNNTSSSVVNFGDNSLDSCSVSEDEKEQKEVAMSLIMLSRDVRPWFGINSIPEFSDNNDNDENSLELEAPLTHLVSKIEGKKFITNSSEIVKMNKKAKKLDFGDVVSSDVKSKLEEEGSDGLKMKKARVSVVENGKDEKKKMEIEVDSDLAFEVNVRTKSGTTNGTSMKENFVDSETKVTSEGEFRKRKYQKRGKFECATCNKKFQSYQALGGHRASHKRIKGCSASRNDQSSENGNNTELELEVDVEINVNAEGRMVESERVAEMRDYLDLNLPGASIDDERNGHAEIYKPWWLVGSSLKQEAMIGLLSN